MKVEKKNTIANNISNLKYVNKRAQSISPVTGIQLSSKTMIYNIDCNNTIKNIVPENPKNFPRMKSCLLIGLERIRKIVFPSISLNSN
jgi:hypothetical protein